MININNNNAPIDLAEEFVERQCLKPFYIVIYKNCFVMVLQLMWRWRVTSNKYVLFNFHQEVINHPWECLHDSSEFFRLRDAIIAHVIIVK